MAPTVTGGERDGANPGHACRKPDPARGTPFLPVRGRPRPGVTTAPITRPPWPGRRLRGRASRSRPASTSSTTARWASRPGSLTSTSGRPGLSPGRVEGGFASIMPASRDRQHFPGAYARARLARRAGGQGQHQPRCRRGPGPSRRRRPGGRGRSWRRVGLGVHRPDDLRQDGDGQGPGELQGRPRRRGQGHLRGVPAGGRPRRRPTGWPTSTTRPTRSSSTRSPTCCTRSTQAIIDSGAFLQVDDAVLMHEADTMLSRGQSWEDYRRVGAAAGGRAQPRAARAARGPDQVPRLLRQLARAARLRPAAARLGRPGARGATRSTT